MTLTEQTAFFKRFTEKQAEIMLSKGNDYAGEDRLSNFKLVGQICGLSPEMVAMVMEATKIVRLGQLMRGKEPSNESIDDSILDGSNYYALWAMLRCEAAHTENSDLAKVWNEIKNVDTKYSGVASVCEDIQK